MVIIIIVLYNLSTVIRSANSYSIVFIVFKIEAFVFNYSNLAIIFDVVYVVIEAMVNNTSNNSIIVNVVYVVEIGASINNRSNAADIIDIANVVRTFLGLFFSVNEEVCGTWFPRDLGVQGEKEADCQGKKCYLRRAHLASPMYTALLPL